MASLLVSVPASEAQDVGQEPVDPSEIDPPGDAEGPPPRELHDSDASFENPPVPRDRVEEYRESLGRDPGFEPGASVVVEELTTPDRLVYENPDGSRRAVLNSSPVRFRDPANGEWRDYDLEVVDRDGALRARASDLGVRIPTEGGSELVRVASDAGDIGVRLTDRGESTRAPGAAGR
ncbi:MAG: hypothetical protein U5R31_16775 [Acidimicrobiia bacterium]|nr:hypothetical protein [Acidimicrobiia bacterium]